MIFSSDNAGLLYMFYRFLQVYPQLLIGVKYQIASSNNI